MSTIINTIHGQVVSSEAINKKVESLFGSNVVVNGFDVNKVTDTSISITPGKAIVCGASIEEDTDTTIVEIPSNMLSNSILSVVIEYIHENKEVNIKIVNSITSQMVVLANLIMNNSIIDSIESAEKVSTLNDLSKMAKDLSTGLLDNQHLSYKGDKIKIENSSKAKTQNINIKGVTKQNLVQAYNRERFVSAEYQKDADIMHTLTDVQNGYLDLNIKGNTIQNLVKGIGLMGETTLEGDIVTCNTPLTYTGISGEFYYILKANTTYSFVINILQNTVDVPVELSLLSGGIWKKASYVTLNAVGIKVFKVVTPTDVNINGFKVQTSNRTTTGIFKFRKNIMLLEGDYTNVPIEEVPYINSIKSAGEQEANKYEVVSLSKNLFDKNNYKIVGGSAFYSTQIGAVSIADTLGDPSHKWCVLKLSVGKTYSITGDFRNSNPNNWTNAILESCDSDFILGSSYRTLAVSKNSTDSVFTATVTTTMPYIFIHIGHSDNYTAGKQEALDSIMVEENPSCTEYEAYKEHKLTYILPEPLRSLPNGVCDEITTDGMVIRRIKKLQLDGSEEWRSAIFEDAVRFDLTISDVKSDPNWDGRTDVNIMCDKLSAEHFMSIYRGEKAGATLYLKGDYRVLVMGFKNEITTLENFKTWLSTNKPTVYYELEEPITHPVDSVALPNGVKDEVYDSKIIRNVGKVTLNGSEAWSLDEAKSDNYITFYCSNLAGKKGATSRTVIDVLSNRFKAVANKTLVDSPTSDMICSTYDVSGKVNASIAICIEKNKLSTADVAGLKAWLSKNPTTVWYELATSTTDTSDIIPRIRCYGGVTYIKTNSTLMPTIKIDSKGHKFPVLIEAGKEYNVITSIKDSVYNVNIDLGGSKVSLANKRYYCEAITTPATLSHDNLYISGWNTKVGDIIVTKDDVYGDEYFNGLFSSASGELIIKSSNKNLFTKEDMNVGYALAQHNGLYADSKYFSSTFIKVKPKTDYILHKVTWGWYVYGNKLKKASFPCTFEKPTKITTPADCHYIRITSFNSSIDEVMIEECSAATEYVKPETYTKSVTLDEPLRSLPNGVCDEIIDGKLIRRIGKKVFDTAAGWRLNNIETANNIAQFTCNRALEAKSGMTADANIFCDTRLTKPNNGGGPNTAWIYQGTTAVLQFDPSQIDTLEKFSKWIKANPTTFIYELDQPIITDIDADLNVKTFDGTTYIETEDKVRANLEFDSPANLRAIINQVSERITEAEKLVDELLLPNIVETDYERTLLEFDYEMSKFSLKGDE